MMNAFLTVVLTLCCVKFSLEYEYSTRYFKQKVDHFGFSNSDYFLQRYLIADQYWNRNNGPIFFYTGNEGDITSFANNTGFMWESAATFKALVVFAEHRYYGFSLPYGEESMSIPEKRGYLSTEQALADFASLIYYLKGNLISTSQSKTVAFGGSYGGMLAAWLRIKYPHIVDGAISSSAPIALLSNSSLCGRFAEVVTQDFHQSGQNCSESIKKSWSSIRKVGKTDAGLKWLSSTFRVCKAITPNDISNFINWLEDTWSYLAMTNYPYETTFLRPLPANPVKEACSYLNSSKQPDEDLLSNIFKAASVFHNFTGDMQCFNYSAPELSSLGLTAWSYQSCTELVLPQCQNGISDMFEPSAWDFNKFSSACEKQWNISPDLIKVFLMYGGKNITSSSNIFFTNGNLDPWYPGGILSSLSSSLLALVIDRAAHHLDLRAHNSKDPTSVLAARAQILDFIDKRVLRQ